MFAYLSIPQYNVIILYSWYLLTLFRCVSIDVVVQDDQKENGHAQNIGKHSQLNVGDHGALL